MIEAPFFALAGVLAAAAYARMQPNLAPLGAAAAFTCCEWIRSVGVLAQPFDQLGYTQADGPLRAIAAYAGTYGITFALCAIGAYGADALRRRTWRPFTAAIVAVAAATIAAWSFWPARALPPPAIPVAAIQGNIAQSFKWTPRALGVAVHRYTTMTRSAAAAHPRLVVWPETVITTELDANPALFGRFSDLAHQVRATLVVGSLAAGPEGLYNALYIFAPHGGYVVYDKRQLVPFAEWFPGHRFLSWVPYIGALNGGLTPGTADGVYPTSALSIAPLICWESAFADLAHAQVSKGRNCSSSAPTTHGSERPPDRTCTRRSRNCARSKPAPTSCELRRPASADHRSRRAMADRSAARARVRSSRAWLGRG